MNLVSFYATKKEYEKIIKILSIKSFQSIYSLPQNLGYMVCMLRWGRLLGALVSSPTLVDKRMKAASHLLHLSSKPPIHTLSICSSACALSTKNHTTIILVVGQADTSCKASSHFCYTRDKCRKLWGNERKWEEKEEMERKWREMEEMEREEISLCLSLHFTSLSPFLRSLHILLLFPFPHSVPISMLPGCRRLWQPVVGVVWTKTHNKLVTH